MGAKKWPKKDDRFPIPFFLGRPSSFFLFDGHIAHRRPSSAHLFFCVTPIFFIFFYGRFFFFYPQKIKSACENIFFVFFCIFYWKKNISRTVHCSLLFFHMNFFLTGTFLFCCFSQPEFGFNCVNFNFCKFLPTQKQNSICSAHAWNWSSVLVWTQGRVNQARVVTHQPRRDRTAKFQYWFDCGWY